MIAKCPLSPISINTKQSLLGLISKSDLIFKPYFPLKYIQSNCSFLYLMSYEVIMLFIHLQPHCLAQNEVWICASQMNVNFWITEFFGDITVTANPFINSTAEILFRRHFKFFLKPSVPLFSWYCVAQSVVRFCWGSWLWLLDQMFSGNLVVLE